MVLPFGRIVAQVIVPLVAVIARALPAAYSQALANARRNGVDATQTASNMLRKELSKSEAMQILNLSTEAQVTAEAVQKQYEKYFAANAVEKGGSFYLQSKVYRAKEQLDQYLAEKKLEESRKSSQSNREDMSK